MDENIDSNVAVLAILDDPNSVYKPDMPMPTYNESQTINQEITNANETSKQNIIWTKEASLTLLSIYEAKMHMLDNPKKKSKMWLSIAEDLKTYCIEATPDQVRWKINALTKKYRDCIDSGQGSAASFKYFNEMHQILGPYSDNSGTYRLGSGTIHIHNGDKTRIIKPMKSSKPFRKLREERKVKLDIDKQWIEYLKRQEEQKEIRDEKFERSLWLREEELKLRKKEIELKQTIAMRKLQLKERKHEEIMKIEREKCDLLKKILENQDIMRQ